MNKKLIAVALAALPVAAMAEVTLYGNVELDVENGKSYQYNFVNKSNGKLNSGTRIDDTGSLIGFKGSEDLGSGLKAIWQVEQGLNLDGTTGAASGNGYNNTFATRDSFVGLQGDFGKVRLGRLSTFNNSDMGNADSWIYGKGMNGLYYSSINLWDGRVNNAIRYDSPEFAGFRGTVLYGADEVRPTVGGSRANQATWNVGLGYQNGPFYGNFGYVTARDQADVSGQQKNNNYWRLEGGYAANNLSLDAYYGQQKFYDVADNFKAKEAGVTVGYTIGALTPKFSYGRVWDRRDAATDTKLADDKIDQYIIGVDYAMSKRTTSYVSFGAARHSDNALETEHTLGVGLRHKF